jgi:hypothetical protein
MPGFKPARKYQFGYLSISIVKMQYLLITAVYLSLVFTPSKAYTQTYSWTFLRTNPAGEPLPFISQTDKDAYILRGSYKPMFPCVLFIPGGTGYDWLEKPDPLAEYLMFYASHGGDHLSLAWAEDLSGPWYAYNNPAVGTGSQGVITMPSGWDHISSPDVYIDSIRKQVVMLFHGKDQDKHTSRVATSKNGLFFDGFIPGGQDSSGIHSVTISSTTRAVYTDAPYGRAFFYDSDNDGLKELYSIGKRAQISKAPEDLPETNIIESFANTIGEFETTWPFQNGSVGQNYTFAGGDSIESILRKPLEYFGPVAEFMRSVEFLTHPDNPHPGHYISSVGSSGREPVETGPGWVNHVDAAIGDFDYDGIEDELEVFFYMNRNIDSYYNGIYRVVMDLTDRRTPDEINAGVEPFHSWIMERDSEGLTMFETILSPENMATADEPDGVPLGDPNVFIDKDGSKYLFFAYGPEGRITAVKLEPIKSFSTDTGE